VVRERLLVILRETVLLTGEIDLLTEIGGTWRRLVACSLKHRREIAIAVVKRVFLRLFARCWRGRIKRRIKRRTVLGRRRCLMGLVSATGNVWYALVISW
jgi:hypothetical protein